MKLGFCVMLVVLFGWALVGRLPQSAAAHPHDARLPRVQRFVPLSFRYTGDIKAKIRESQSICSRLIDDTGREVEATLADSFAQEVLPVLSGIDLRFHFMSLQL